MFFRGPRYDFIGVINADDTTQVWMGLNTAGFAIMNSESMDQEGDSADTEGFFMKQALGLCGTIDELQKLLEATNQRGRGTRANFGCIDAFDGAAFFETGNHTFTRMDARDTTLSKHGFLARANFSMTGQNQEGDGCWRFHRAKKLLSQFAINRSLTVELMFDKIIRDLVSDDLNPYPLPYNGQYGEAPPGFISTQNTINRHSTVSCAVFQGVKKGEDPAQATMWTALGQPVCSVALPLWPRAGSVPTAWNGPKGADLNRRYQFIRNKMYPNKKLNRYLNSKKLYEGKPCWAEKRQKLEAEVFTATRQAMQQWRQAKPTDKELAEFQTKWTKKVFNSLEASGTSLRMDKF